MTEEDNIFKSKIKYNGIFPFADFYKFCFEWVRDETGITGLNETKYSEKLAGDSKNIEIEWEGTKDLTDYFRLKVKVSFRIVALVETEITQGTKKVKTNKGSIEVTIKSILQRDYKGMFETNGIQKFLRGVYEKIVIPERVDQFKDKIFADSDEFLSQAKAYLDLEGKK